MPKFMLIVHGTPYADLPPTERQQMLEKYYAWGEKVRAAGIVVNGEKLAEEGGKTMGLQNGRVTVTDGPYSETKEVVGGFMVVRLNSYQEAIELCRDHPHLAFGGRLLVRQTDPMGRGE
jgi:hypothetical protein